MFAPTCRSPTCRGAMRAVTRRTPSRAGSRCAVWFSERWATRPSAVVLPSRAFAPGRRERRSERRSACSTGSAGAPALARSSAGRRGSSAQPRARPLAAARRVVRRPPRWRPPKRAAPAPAPVGRGSSAPHGGSERQVVCARRTLAAPTAETPTGEVSAGAAAVGRSAVLLPALAASAGGGPAALEQHLAGPERDRLALVVLLCRSTRASRARRRRTPASPCADIRAHARACPPYTSTVK